jgi:outer membrane protein OmpA-like peptidoglycan-associated protein
VLGRAALVVCGGLGLFYRCGPRTESSDLETTGGTGQLAVLATTSTTGDGEAAQTTEAPGSTAATSPPGTLTGRVAGEEILVEGEVPSTQSAAALKLLLEQVMGVGNVNTDGVAINAAASSPDRIDVIVDSELVFPSGSAEIQPEFLVTLDRMATLMMTNTGVTTVVEGHADSRGDKAVNLSLSQRRADSVVAYLESKGIESTRLTPVGKGSTEPIADDSTEEGRRQNRRIEFSVQGFRLEL